MTPLKKLAGQTAIYGMSSIIGRLLNFFLVPWYTRIFTTEQYGIVGEMYTYVALLIIVLTLGMETAFFRYSSQSIDKNKVYSTAFYTVLLASVSFMFFVTLFATPISQILKYPDHSEYVVWFAFIIGLDAFTSIPLAKLREANKALQFTLVNLSNIIINIGFNIFFLIYCKEHYNQYGAESNWLVTHFYNPAIGVGYVFIANLIATSVKTAILFPTFKYLSLTFDIQLFKKLLWYSFPLMLAGLAGMVNETLDRALLKHILAEKIGLTEALEQVGIYGACYKISIVISLFIQAFRYAADPFFFGNKNLNIAQELYSNVMNFFVIFCCFIFLVVVMFMDVFLLFIGEEFRVGSGIIPVLLLANIFLGMYYNLSVWFKLTDRTYYGTLMTFIGSVITVGFNFWLIPSHGYWASAWATLICYFSITLVSYLLGRKYYPIPYQVVKILFFIVLVVIMAMAKISINTIITDLWLQNSIGVAFVVSFIIIVIYSEKALLNFLKTQKAVFLRKN